MFDAPFVSDPNFTGFFQEKAQDVVKFPSNDDTDSS